MCDNVCLQLNVDLDTIKCNDDYHAVWNRIHPVEIQMVENCPDKKGTVWEVKRAEMERADGEHAEVSESKHQFTIRNGMLLPDLRNKGTGTVSSL